MTVYAIADDIAWVSREDLDSGDQPVAYVASLPHGPPIVLEGPACLVWLLLADGGSVEDIARGAAELAGLTTAEVIDDVEVLLSELVEVGVARTL
ncbi:PqqD family peptide modification chaperone [Nocardioides sp.]|uniref:PqqD family peptide modification chaperone n=1 Tax=Nocardioides sp. TaxID=35761 RepID=UPI00286E571A|nr:PqqD family peptide modification chaperone [Nocardioides sp.]